jgi:hypothetical protein
LFPVRPKHLSATRALPIHEITAAVIAFLSRRWFEITTRYGRTAVSHSPTEPRSSGIFPTAIITAINAKKFASIEGLPEKAIEQLRFTDINATGETGFIVDNVADLELHHMRVTATRGSAFEVIAGTALVFDDVSPRTESGKTAGVALTGLHGRVRG